MTNHLYYGDNLSVLRESIADESVDLVYLDPPFNSNASYNVLFKGPAGNESAAQIEAFDDTWHWTDAAEDAFGEVLTSGNSDAAEMLRAMRTFLGENDMMAYLTMMAVRLIELHRVLKPTGSLYLHCDPTASHYLKILLDAVFGAKNFKNEIVWRRTGSHNSSKRFGPIHDIIFYFVKDATHSSFNRQVRPYTKSHVEHAFIKDGDTYRTNYSGNVLTGAGTRDGLSGRVWMGFDPTAKGRHWALPSKMLFGIEDQFEGLNQTEKFDKLFEMGMIRIEDGLEWPKYERTITANDGQYLSDIWAYQPGTEGVLYGTENGIDRDVAWLGTKDQERLGYPTQKPVALLERIVAASSNEGDVVLDPFCGCGTTVHAAQKLGRRWIGIDVTHLAIGLIERRLRDAFEDVSFITHGTPKDIGGAKALAAQDKYEFEKWALSLVPNAQPWKGGRKGADKGIDGILYVGKKSDRCIISVKGGGNVGVAMIRDLIGVLDREKAPMGLFVTLTPPTKPMITEAAGAGQWEVEGLAPVPRVQIVTIEDLLTSIAPPIRLPLARSDTYKKAAREEKNQGKLDL